MRPSPHLALIAPLKSSIAPILSALKPRGTIVVIDLKRIPGVSRVRTLDHVRA